LSAHFELEHSHASMHETIVPQAPVIADCAGQFATPQDAQAALFGPDDGGLWHVKGPPGPPVLHADARANKLIAVTTDATGSTEGQAKERHHGDAMHARLGSQSPKRRKRGFSTQLRSSIAATSGP
jgi:hypothetical protein